MADSKKKKSAKIAADPFRLSLKDFEDEIKSKLYRSSARTNVKNVLKFYNVVRKTEAISDACKKELYKFLKDGSWVTSYQFPSPHRFYKQLRAKGRKEKTLYFPKWLIVAAQWPSSPSVKEIADDMSTLWGERFPGTDPFFPQASLDEDEQMVKFKGIIEDESEDDSDEEMQEDSDAEEDAEEDAESEDDIETEDDEAALDEDDPLTIFVKQQVEATIGPLRRQIEELTEANGNLQSQLRDIRAAPGPSERPQTCEMVQTFAEIKSDLRQFKDDSVRNHETTRILLARLVESVRAMSATTINALANYDL
ncbi:hypothetical protein NW762_000232 [Fusarium torreyae]|uniref:Uncharacterized protein n=1 Tax=Fusarium torreyae TaxID=1237075 RepID=A0A9W8SH24_9HYPO|nr:hypothetical protein NW762_000232 [Fusarium torreyae]